MQAKQIKQKTEGPQTFHFSKFSINPPVRKCERVGKASHYEKPFTFTFPHLLL